MDDVNKFIEAAKVGVVTVVFEKIHNDGIRTMKCTLNRKLSKENIPEVFKQREQNDHIVVWALDRDAWRSFRVSTVIEWYNGTKTTEEEVR